MDLVTIVAKENADDIRQAIRAGADPNEPHPRAGTLPLQVACQINSLEAIEVLLNAGAKADAVFSRQSRVDGRWFKNHTPLMYCETVDAAKLLVKAGADIQRVDDNGWSALIYAINSTRLDLVVFYLKCGADLSVTPYYDGDYISIIEFIDNHMNFLSENSHQLKQLIAKDRISAFQKVRQLIESNSSS